MLTLDKIMTLLYDLWKKILISKLNIEDQNQLRDGVKIILTVSSAL